MRNENVRNENEVSVASVGIASAVVLALIVGGVALGMWGCPRYDVYSKQQVGMAKLAEAESSRRIAVVEAEAKKDSASKLAEAEVARARGVAQANQIIGDSLKGNEVYLHYLWIHGLQEGKNEIIYVPTEANLPILEAGRGARMKPAEDKKP
jgi:regulator of protease activity HflC (stomatin/prohibitin superfamily)